MSNQSIRAFCRERGLNEHTFYTWRQRLREQPVTFALVDRKPRSSTANKPIEFVLATGDRIRIATMPPHFGWCSTFSARAWHDSPAGQRACLFVLGVVRHEAELRRPACTRRREITVQDLGALLSGIDLSCAKRRERYRRKTTEVA